MGAKILYDTKCRDLADAFLEDSPHLNTEARAVELAGIIQVAVEDYIKAEEDNYEPPDPPGFEGGFAENH
jgi:hypothetical protein